MFANTTAFEEADVIAVMRHYFPKTSTFLGDFGTYFSALTTVFSWHTSSLAGDFPQWLATFSISDSFSTKQIIFANHAKTLFQAHNSKPYLKQTKPSRRYKFINCDCTEISVLMLSLPKC